MNATRSVSAIHKAGRCMATAVTEDHKRIAATYLEMAGKLVEEDGLPFDVAMRHYQNGLKSQRSHHFVPSKENSKACADCGQRGESGIHDTRFI